MVRKLFSLLLLLSVSWQSVGVSGSVAALESVDKSSHAVLHWQEAGHHHHDDGTQHVDDSGDTVQHMHAESVANAVGLVTIGWRDVVALHPAAPAALAHPPHLSPHLPGLLRPPQAAV